MNHVHYNPLQICITGATWVARQNMREPFATDVLSTGNAPIDATQNINTGSVAFSFSGSDKDGTFSSSRDFTVREVFL